MCQRPRPLLGSALRLPPARQLLRARQRQPHPAPSQVAHAVCGSLRARVSEMPPAAHADAIQQQFFKVVCTTLLIITVFTGFVQFVASEDCWTDAGKEPDEEDDEAFCHMAFHDAIYFTFVTFSTVGYGDIAPRGAQGRILTLSMIVCVWTILPVELTQFSRLLEMRSKYSGTYKPKATNHIIISCNVGSVQSVADFLQFFFADDYGVRPTPVVVVVPSEPDEEWNKLLVKYQARQLWYLKGDIIHQQDLLRARADLAVACFILSDILDQQRCRTLRGFVRATHE